MTPAFSLDLFERLAWRRDHEPAMRELMRLLVQLDQQHGLVTRGQPPLDLQRCTRIAAATACLLTDGSLQFSPQWVAPLMALHRWLAALFDASGLGGGDAVLRAMATADDGTVTVTPADIVKFCLLYGAESALPLDMEALARHDSRLALGLAIALLSPRLLATPAAAGKREQLLPWLTARLAGVADVSDVPGDVLHDVYMQCSYAQRADKHDVKRSICALVRRSLQRRGFKALPPPAAHANAHAAGAKPVLLVVVEWFMAGHSMLRTHSRTIDAARAQFEVVGMGYGFAVDAAGRAVFDRFVEIPRDIDIFAQMQQVQAESQRSAAAVLYMPSVGMSSLTVYLANLRVAPLQVMGLGHPATAHAAAVDLVVVEDDYVGDAACFSEPLLRLPPDGMPYRPASDAPRPLPAPRPHAPTTVHIALCATLMKLNPVLLAACADIVRRTPLPVHFHVLVGQAQGLLEPAVRHAVKAFLGASATVHPQQPYARYMAVIDGCDMFVSPFPFGNTNGNIDCVGAGLVGVCLTGPEVHAHIDEGMFRRLGLPGWLVAQTVEDYIAAAVRLASSHDERAALRAAHAGPDKIAVFYAGRPQLMGEMLVQALARASEKAPAALPGARPG